MNKTLPSIILAVITLAACAPAQAENLLENSSFEVGFGSQWGLGFFEDSSADTQPFLLSKYLDQTQAYEGRASLKLSNDKRYQTQQVLSKPYRLKPNQSYVISLYARATQNPGDYPVFSLQLDNTFKSPYGPGDSSGKKSFRASADWQRFSFMFTTADMSTKTTYQLRIRAEAYEAPGYIWIDAVQLEEGSSSSLYKPRCAVEAGLAVPESHLGNSFFENEPLVLQLWQYNHDVSVRNVQINYELYDYYNRQLKSGTISSTLNFSSLARQDLDLTLTDNKLGIFRVLFWVNGVEGTLNELVFSVIPRPRQDINAENSIFGSHIPYESYPLSMMQKIGMHWNCSLSTGRLFRWSEVEPTLGNITWFDDKVDLAKSYGIETLGTMGYAPFTVPSWARYFDVSTSLSFVVNSETSITITKTGGTNFSTLFAEDDEVMVVRMGSNNLPSAFDDNGVYSVDSVSENSLTLETIYKGDDRVYSNASINDANIILLANPTQKRGWQHFVNSVVDHYKDDIKYWAMWSEPDTEAALAYCTECYAAILKIGYTEAKAADAQSKVIGIEAWNSSYINSVIDLIGTDYMEFISSHIYPGNEFGTQRLIDQVYSRYPNKPAWNTQTGIKIAEPFWQTLLSEDQWLPSYEPTSTEHYQYKDAAVIRNFGRTVGSGYVKKYIYYDSRDTTALNVLRTYSLFDWDLSLKPRTVALAILARIFDGSTGEGTVAIHPDLLAYSFRRNATPLLIVWNKNYDPGLFSNNPNALNIAPVYVTPPRVLKTSISEGSVKAYNIMGQKLPIQTGIVVGTDPFYLEGTNVSKEELINSLSVTLGADITAPNISIVTFPTGDSNIKNILFRWHASDNVTPAWNIKDVSYPSLSYSYKLEGYDATWADWNSKRSILYENLPDGNYIYSVKVRDADGNESVASRRIMINVLSAPGNLRMVK